LKTNHAREKAKTSLLGCPWSRNMTIDLDLVLENCLDSLARGATIRACLVHYPEYAAELEPLLAVAVQLKNEANVRPSPAFRARAWAQLRAHMNAHPHTLG
jgi:hypothetical protein